MLLCTTGVTAQTRLTASMGVTTSYGGNVTTLLAKSPSMWCGEIELDKKVLGSLYVVTGLSSYGAGYSATSSFFGPANSDYRARFLAIPIMARWNAGNRNFFYLDFGFSTFYLVSAHLKESIDKFQNGNMTEFEGNVAPYLTRISEYFKFQETVVFNRFSISVFFVYKFKGQSVIKNLGEHWGLSEQQSTFLSSGGYSDFNIGGIKIGIRIR